MNAEQGNVQPWRENVERVRRRAIYMRDNTANGIVDGFCEEVVSALDALTTQIEELERDFAIKDRAARFQPERVRLSRRGVMRQRSSPSSMWEDMRAYNIRLEERAREAERALAEIARLSPFVSPEDDNSIRKAPAIARSALRPEDTSDES